MLKHFIQTVLVAFLLCLIGYYFFSSLYTSQEVIISYGLHPFNICTEEPILWKYLKSWFCISYCLSSFVLSHFLFRLFQKVIPTSFFHSCKKSFCQKQSFLSSSSPPLALLIGKNFQTGLPIYLPEKSLYQNILITGTIGTGKTSSAMYPFTKQLLCYEHQNFEKKLGMLILDVKGNYYEKVLQFAKECHRTEDIIVLELGGKYYYNPLHKPNLKPSILANRLKTILLLFSKNNSESYWLDEAEKVLSEAIKLCRLYNNNYVTFEELHKLITVPSYYESKIELLRKKFMQNQFSKEQVYHLLSSLTFFEKEFLSLDTRTLSILKSEITRITNCFISDYEVLNTFNPPQEKLNFYGFDQVLREGKIVVLKMNISEYANLSKIIAAYLKLDFQTDVMARLAHHKDTNFRSVCFLSDEYSEYCTETDSNFFSQSREAKCINIVATQSYTSLLNTLNQQATVNVILQNLINKLWFRTDDIFTIETAQKQIGKEEKEKVSQSISENAKETVFNYFTNSLTSKNSSISESINTYSQSDFIYDTNFFTQGLENFTCLSFLSDGTKILPPQKISLIPYFQSF